MGRARTRPLPRPEPAHLRDQPIGQEHVASATALGDLAADADATPEEYSGVVIEKLRSGIVQNKNGMNILVRFMYSA